MKKFLSLFLALVIVLPVLSAGAADVYGGCAYGEHIFSTPGNTVCDICGEVFIADDGDIDDDDLNFDFGFRPDGNIDIGVFVCSAPAIPRIH